MRRFVSLIVLMAVSLFPAAAAAQDEGKVGVMMSVPGAIGMVWKTSDRIAVRPEVSFGWSKTDREVGDSESTQFTGGAAVLFYTARWDNLATYIAPRYAFSRTTAETSGPGDGQESSAHVHRFSGSFGAEYRLGTRFDVFGELGLAVDRGSAGSDPDRTTARSVGTRSQVGVVFYF